MESVMFKFCKYLALVCCLIEMVSEVSAVRNQQPVKAQAKADKFEIFKTTNDVLVLMPPEVNFTDSHAKNRSIKVSADIFNQKTRMGSDGMFNLQEQVDIEARSGARETRKVGLFRGLWNKPRVSPLYLVNGTVCRFINASPICTTLVTTGILPANNSTFLPAFGRNGLDSFMQFPTNQQQQFSNNNQQQFSNNQQQFPNNQQQLPQQQFQNNQQFSNINNQPQQQQQFPINQQPQQQQFPVNNQQQARPNNG